MKVGIDGSALASPRTGVGNYIFRILEGLVRSEPTWRFSVYSNRPLSLGKFDNVDVKVSSPYRRGPYWQNTQLARFVRADAPDVFWGCNGIVPMFRPKRTAVVVTIHDLVYRFAPDTLPLPSRIGRRVFQPLAVRDADKLVAVSAATAADIRSTYEREVDAVVHPVVSAAYDRSAVLHAEHVRRKLDLPRRYMLVLGTLEPRKNIPMLVEAYLECIRKGLPLPVLVIAGGNGWLDHHISASIAEGEVLGGIRKLGYVEQADLPGLYAGAEAFIMPSAYEGFGMPILEAQLCCVPVLYSNTPAMREAAGGAGVPFEPTRDGIAAVLTAFARGACPLNCRIPSTIVNSAEGAAATMKDLMLEAVCHRRGRRRHLLGRRYAGSAHS
jgi:glycosyltransferase involved in cell wall biosynthesis